MFRSELYYLSEAFLRDPALANRIILSFPNIYRLMKLQDASATKADHLHLLLFSKFSDARFVLSETGLEKRHVGKVIITLISAIKSTSLFHAGFDKLFHFGLLVNKYV